MGDLNHSAIVEVLYPAKATIGEGPFYEQETDTLLWVDILKKTVNFLHVTTGTNRSFQFSETTSAVIPVENSDKLVVLLGRKICLVDRESGTITDVLETVEKDKPENRLNDAKCDSSGRLWCGTMCDSQPADRKELVGGFYSYSSGVTKEHSNAGISNGIGWNLVEDTMYHIDSLVEKVYSYSYCRQDGSTSNKKIFIDYAQEDGCPDGMCIDTKGRLWVAIFNGQQVICWDPQTKEKLMTLKIPGAKKITSCCFGGPNYEWMFVTSGSSEEELGEFPNAGAVFVVKDLGAKGSPPHKFKLTMNEI